MPQQCVTKQAKQLATSQFANRLRCYPSSVALSLHIIFSMKWFALFVAAYASFLSVVQCQDYVRGAGLGRRRNNRGPIIAAAATGVLGGVLGGWVVSSRLKRSHEKEKKELVQYLSLQEEIYKQREKQWQTEYKKLYKAYEDLEKETIERDYEEFKAPDTNNDDMISRAEFNTYVRKYLSSFPELSEKDFPKFEEFDLDGDGIVSFDEWQQFLYLQKQMEAQKAEKASKAGKDNQAYNDLLSALYEQSQSSDSFNTLNKQIAAGSKGNGNNARRAM